MLSNPKCGWVDVIIESNTIEPFVGYASYLTEVPLDCLDNMIFALENYSDFITSFDAEGWMYKVIADEYRTYVIVERDKPELLIFDNKDIFDLANEIVDDISKDIDEWSRWSCSIDIDDDGNLIQSQVEDYKNTLLEKIDTLKKVIENRKNR
jgi:hypothetical protein